MKWIEFWANKDNKGEWEQDLFKVEKSSLPTTQSSKPLKVFLNGVKSELTGTTLNKTKPNITREEAEALKTLIYLQKNRTIILTV